MGYELLRKEAEFFCRRGSFFRPVLRAVLARGLAGFALEGDGKILNVGEPGALGNFIERKVCLREQLLHAFELHTQDFLVRRAPDEFHEAFFHEAAGLGHRFDDVLYINAVASMVANVMKHADNDEVVYRQDDQ